MKSKKDYCLGCREDFYNGKNNLNIKECWNFKTAKICARYRIGWWIPQDKKENFTKVTTLDCHSEPGQFAFYSDLPQHLKYPK